MGELPDLGVPVDLSGDGLDVEVDRPESRCVLTVA
jgi:hypothetical protein